MVFDKVSKAPYMNLDIDSKMQPESPTLQPNERFSIT